MDMHKFDFSKIGFWLDGSGQFSEIILSSRLRLHRNIKNKRFVSWSNNQELAEVTNNLLEVLTISQYLKNCSVFNFEIEEKPVYDLFPERFLVNYKFINSSHPRALIVGENEVLSVIINNHDHLNIQVYQSGLNLDDDYLLLSKIEDELEEHLNFSYSEQFGYLSALPTLAGTGMKASIIAHLPAMLKMGELETIMKTLSKLRCNFTSLFSSGHQIIQGDLFIISNQVTLGITEEEIIDSLAKIGIEIFNYEQSARDKMFRLNKYQIEDDIFRSLGVLQNARSISFDEVISNLSMVRLGCAQGLIKDISSKTLNKLLITLQTQHLKLLNEESLNIDSENYIRAEILRKELKNENN